MNNRNDEIFDEEEPKKEEISYSFSTALMPLVLVGFLLYFFDGIYAKMVLYVIFSFMFIAVTKHFFDDMALLISAVLLPMIAPIVAPFSPAFRIYLFGQIIILMDNPYQSVYNASLFRRRYGSLCSTIGLFAIIIGIGWGIYNIVMN